MTTGIPPKKNTALVFYLSLVSQANPKILQTNPTLAAGDVKVSTDGAAFGNLATLPTVTPAGGTGVKVSLSAGEMNGDDVLVVFEDAAGAEWCSRSVSVKTADRWINDLAFPLTTGRGTLIDAAGGVTLTNAQGIKKNTALAGFVFPMFLTDGTEAGSLTVAVTRVIDGAARATATNSPAVFVSNGTYTIDLSAADLNGNDIEFRATATGCVPTRFTIHTVTP